MRRRPPTLKLRPTTTAAASSPPTHRKCATANGHAELELHTRADNHPAIAFYERAGWTVTDRVIHTVERGIDYDIEYDERVLVKRVDAAE